ncbi:MAG: IS21-like element helper ATPase IstB [Clostridia bacterium]|nr:IS21-like element helper ATPase IstB [Clostridia bacterium]
MSDIQADISKIANDLKLSVFARYDKYIKSGRPLEENLLALLKEQAVEADNARVNRKIRYSGFPVVKTLNAFEVTPERFPHLNINEFNELASCRFIEEKADVVAIGPPGRGKTHAALAIGHEAIKHGYSVRFKRAADLVNEMSEAKTEKSLGRYTKTLNNCRLLILDEIGFLPYDSTASSFLFQIISARYETASTFFTTNFPFSKWPQFIQDKGIVTAIVDRIAHHSIMLNMNGPMAWRFEHARSRANGLLNE